MNQITWTNNKSCLYNNILDGWLSLIHFYQLQSTFCAVNATKTDWSDCRVFKISFLVVDIHYTTEWCSWAHKVIRIVFFGWSIQSSIQNWILLKFMLFFFSFFLYGKVERAFEVWKWIYLITIQHINWKFYKM